MTNAAVSAAEFRRLPARISADKRNAYDFIILTKGSWVGRLDEAELTVGPGELVALDLGQPYEIAMTAVECVILSIARDTLFDAVSREADFHGHVFRGCAGALLTDHCLSLARHIGGMQTNEVAAVRAATIALTAAAVTLIDPHEDFRTSVLKTRHAVQRHIDRNLTDEGLSSESIIRELDISRSDVWSRCVVVRLTRHGGTRYGPASSRQRHDD